MKRIMALILAAVMIFSMTACGEKKLSNENANMNTNETKTNEKTYTLDDLAIRDKETGKLIRLGDTREEVEKITGAADETEEWTETDIYYGYKDEINVLYDANGQAAKIWVSFWESDRYELPLNIDINSTKTDFLNAYPDAVEASNGMQIGLLLKQQGNKYHLCSKEEFDQASVSGMEYVYIAASYYEEEIDGIEVSAIPFFFDN